MNIEANVTIEIKNVDEIIEKIKQHGISEEVSVDEVADHLCKKISELTKKTQKQLEEEALANAPESVKRYYTQPHIPKKTGYVRRTIS